MAGFGGVGPNSVSIGTSAGGDANNTGTQSISIGYNAGSKYFTEIRYNNSC